MGICLHSLSLCSEVRISPRRPPAYRLPLRRKLGGKIVRHAQSDLDACIDAAARFYTGERKAGGRA